MFVVGLQVSLFFYANDRFVAERTATERRASEAFELKMFVAFSESVMEVFRRRRENVIIIVKCDK